MDVGKGVRLRHPVVVLNKVDNSYLKIRMDVKDLPDVYFVAFMSSKLLVEEEYKGNATDYFELGSIIKSREHIFLETRCDLSVNLFIGTQEKPVSELEINTGLAQAALGSLLAEHRNEESSNQQAHEAHGTAGSRDQKPLIMSETHRTAITERMSQS